MKFLSKIYNIQYKCLNTSLNFSYMVNIMAGKGTNIRIVNSYLYYRIKTLAVYKKRTIQNMVNEVLEKAPEFSQEEMSRVLTEMKDNESKEPTKESVTNV
jgi:hypothetical protein